MFGFGKKKKTKKAPVKPSSEEIRRQALENAQKARERIGEETLDRIAAQIEANMRKKESSDFEHAKNRVKQMDKDKVADHVRMVLRDED